MEEMMRALEADGWFQGPGEYGALRRAFLREKVEALARFGGDRDMLPDLDRALVWAGIGEQPGVALASVAMWDADWPANIQYTEDIESLLRACCEGSFGLLKLETLEVSLDTIRLSSNSTVTIEMAGEGFEVCWNDALGASTYEFWPYMGVVHRCLQQVAPGWSFYEHEVDEPLRVAVLTPPGLDPKPHLPAAFDPFGEDSWGEDEW